MRVSACEIRWESEWDLKKEEEEERERVKEWCKRKTEPQNCEALNGLPPKRGKK